MGGWAVVIPVKRLAVGKTRLASFAGQRRSELALALAADTLAAVVACSGVGGSVRGIAVVTDDPDVADLARSLGARPVPDLPDAGLNQALLHGASVAMAQWQGSGVAALSSDLPALRADELTRALQAASGLASCFVADTDGAGTTLLAAASLDHFEPRFGAGSAAAHRAAGAVELVGLEGLESVRRDVDTEADLAVAETLGLGPRTRAFLASMRT